jgi:FkbM family methyltransferase
MESNMGLNKICFEKLTGIYRALQDEESKQIFMYRLRFALEKEFISPLEHPAIPLPEESELQESVMEFLNRISEFSNAEINCHIENRRPMLSLYELIRNYDGKNRIIIYGAGNFGKCTKDFLEASRVKVSCFCDTKKYGNVFCGINIISPDDLTADDYVVISIGCTSARTEIYDFLTSKGFSPARISMCYATFNQYFDYPFLQKKENETYIDAGCCDGTTIVDYVEFCEGSYKKIIGFEADKNNYNKTVKLLKNRKIRNAVILQKGTWSKSGVLNFTGTGNETAKISSVSADSFGGGGGIEVCRLDDELATEAGNLFLKMDIEGSEIEALKGMESTIKNKKPRIAISVYHKPEDIIDIPFFLQKMVPEYKFYLRHDCLVNLTETVLYAIL